MFYFDWIKTVTTSYGPCSVLCPVKPCLNLTQRPYQTLKERMHTAEGYWRGGRYASQPRTGLDCCRGYNSEKEKKKTLFDRELVQLKKILISPRQFVVILRSGQNLGSCVHMGVLWCGSTSGQRSWSGQNTEIENIYFFFVNRSQQITWISIKFITQLQYEVVKVDVGFTHTYQCREGPNVVVEEKLQIVPS